MAPIGAMPFCLVPSRCQTADGTSLAPWRRGGDKSGDGPGQRARRKRARRKRTRRKRTSDLGYLASGKTGRPPMTGPGVRDKRKNAIRPGDVRDSFFSHPADPIRPHPGWAIIGRSPLFDIVGPSRIPASGWPLTGMAVGDSLPSLCHPRIASLQAAPPAPARQWQTGRERPPFRIILFIFARGQGFVRPVPGQTGLQPMPGPGVRGNCKNRVRPGGRVPELYVPRASSCSGCAAAQARPLCLIQAGRSGPGLAWLIEFLPDTSFS
jgi:hypothetical protein